MIKMSVAGIALDPNSAQPIVVLNDETRQRGLPIWIGAMEARAISLALSGMKVSRPMTHDLLLNIIHALDSEVEHIEIDKLEDSIYRATIKLTTKDSDDSELDAERFIDARPSDAIALAVAVGCPILVAEGLELVIDDGEELDAQFKEFVRDVKASDFGRIPSGYSDPDLDADADADDQQNIA